VIKLGPLTGVERKRARVQSEEATLDAENRLATRDEDERGERWLWLVMLWYEQAKEVVAMRDGNKARRRVMDVSLGAQVGISNRRKAFRRNSCLHA